MFISRQSVLAKKIPNAIKSLMGNIAMQGVMAAAEQNAPTPAPFLMADGVKIAVNNLSLRDSDATHHVQQAQFLARQDRWEDLSKNIRLADLSRGKCSDGTSVAEQLIFGARADVVAAATHALLHGTPAEDADFYHGIKDMEQLLTESPEDYTLGLIVAHMHMDIGRAWRGYGAEDAVSEENRAAYAHHFARAEEIIDSYCPHELDSPALSAARCALLAGPDREADSIADDYEDLIDLDPGNARHMRALGTYLLPQWYGDYQQIDREARRTAARTHDLWGSGGYTWVWFDALLMDPNSVAHLDCDYFLEGVADILSRSNSQDTANLMAAQVYAIWQASFKAEQKGQTTIAQTEALRRGFADIVHNNLREVHPLIWGQTEIGTDTASRSVSLDRLAKKGRDIALNAVAQPFAKLIMQGTTIHIGRDGITALHP